MFHFTLGVIFVITGLATTCKVLLDNIGFTRVTNSAKSSSNCPKHLLAKTSDPYLALLAYRNTPMGTARVGPALPDLRYIQLKVKEEKIDGL